MTIIYTLFYKLVASSDPYKELGSSPHPRNINDIYRYLEQNCNQASYEWEVREVDNV